MADVKTQSVRKALHANYLKKAAECEELMKVAMGQGKHNAAAILAVHCGISAADALTVFFLGVRHAGQNHSDTQRLLRRIKDPEMNKITRHLMALLGIKGKAEYEERLITATEAKTAVTHAERLLARVRDKVAGS